MLFTASSSPGIAHISSFTGLPESVATSNSKPALSKWYIGRSISTGWLPVENMLPFCIRM